MEKNNYLCSLEKHSSETSYRNNYFPLQSIAILNQNCNIQFAKKTINRITTAYFVSGNVSIPSQLKTFD